MRLFSLLTLLLLGTGCANSSVTVEDQTVESSATIAGLTFEIPSPWFVVENNETEVVIRTETDPYDVDFVMQIEKIDEVDTFDGLAATTSVAQIYNVAQGGAFDWYYMSIGEQNYSIVWKIESTQPLPAGLDGIWVPDHKASRDQLLNILKTVSVQK